MTEETTAPVDDAFFHTRENPWYGAGVALDDAPDVETALAAAGLDWTVEKRKLFHQEGRQRHQVEEKYAVVRASDQKTLGLVGRNYQVVQNREAFEFANTLLDAGVRFDAGGSYRGGRRVFLVAEIPGGFEVGGEDPHGLYLFLVTSHDGTLAVTAAVTPVRLSCTNMVGVALRRAKTRWKIRHTSSFEGQVINARESLKLTHQAAKDFDLEMQNLMAQPLNDREFEAIVEAVLPDSARKAEKVDQLLWVLHESENLDGHRADRYGAFNAFTEWLDWGREIRTDEARFTVSFDGYGARQRHALYELLTAS